ncbi:MAG TPA: DNA primase [Solirubrobacteraceae bacterium]|nr:DNA primase [Solirubrobacteraceae bacterium]
MPLYTADSRDRVRDAVDFIELVSTRTELRRVGPSSYEGLCPFHDERTPSFGIDPARKVYYCFGCQARGDVFTFVQDTEGVDFKEALELLADRCGIELQLAAEDPGEAERRRRRERLLELLARTAAYYERCLWESKEAARAREYLAGRGLSEESLRAFGVGYSPSAWDRVLLASRRGGYSEQELYLAGLVQRSQENGRLYDRFRGRIMFPLADLRGRVLGFGARALRADGEESRAPKYLNTSDNTVYHKGRHLYGAHLARAHAARAGASILCEGYTDVIALHQAGLTNAVGLMGTALTAEQVGELARMAPLVLLALDADTAGQEAMLRASQLAAKRKLELRVVTLPGGMDPAELVQRKGAEAVNAAVAEAVPLVRFRVQRVLDAGDHSGSEGRDRMLEELRPVFATLPPSAMRMELTRLAAGRLELPESLAETLLAARGGEAAAGAGAGGAAASRRGGQGDGGGSGAGGGPAGRGGPSHRGEAERSVAAGGHGGRRDGEGSELARREETERTFLALCIASPEHGAPALAALDPRAHFTSERLGRAAEHLHAGHLGEPMEGIDEQDPQLTGVLAELVVQAGREFPAPAMLEVQRLQLELAHVERRIQAARLQGSGEVAELARRRGEVKLEFERAYELALQDSGG